ncbi:MAG: superoxide dismutase [Candidatus Izemoplasmatales bacterium]|nr:superoxide dismutase [Candidatus Izemoplasmatales bacterium]
MKYVLNPLNYPYNALEPHIDELTMTIHHTKHHQGYVNNLNAALEKHPELHYDNLETLLLEIDKLPFDIQTAVKNNGGGTFNHNLFFDTLKLNENGLPSGALLSEIVLTFGSFESFKDAFSNAAKTRFGSGWAWLIKNHKGALEVVSTPNQDPVLNLGTPLLGLDVWEHAYYLKYQNRRPDYVENFFHVIDWDKVSQRFLKK